MLSPFSVKNHGLIVGENVKIEPLKKKELKTSKTSSDRVFYRLLENLSIIEIKQSKQIIAADLPLPLTQKPDSEQNQA